MSAVRGQQFSGDDDPYDDDDAPSSISPDLPEEEVTHGTALQAWINATHCPACGSTGEAPHPSVTDPSTKIRSCYRCTPKKAGAKPTNNITVRHLAELIGPPDKENYNKMNIFRILNDERKLGPKWAQLLNPHLNEGGHWSDLMKMPTKEALQRKAAERQAAIAQRRRGAAGAPAGSSPIAARRTITPEMRDVFGLGR